jgi:hypothetical protein
MVDDSITGHAEGFNSTMRAFLKKEYGRDIFEEAATATGQ